MTKRLPPEEYRFSSTNQPENRGHRGPSMVTELKKLLEKKIDYEDPTTKKSVNGKIKYAVVLRLVYNALEGDTRAIEEIMERIDGKVTQKAENVTYNTMMPTIKIDGKPLELDIGD